MAFTISVKVESDFDDGDILSVYHDHKFTLRYIDRTYRRVANPKIMRMSKSESVLSYVKFSLRKLLYLLTPADLTNFELVVNVCSGVCKMDMTRQVTSNFCYDDLDELDQDELKIVNEYREKLLSETINVVSDLLVLIQDSIDIYEAMIPSTNLPPTQINPPSAPINLPSTPINLPSAPINLISAANTTSEEA